MAIDFEKVEQLLTDFSDAGVIDDRIEYTMDDLASSNPDLNESEIACIWTRLQDYKDFKGIDLTNIDPKICKEYMMETLHNGCDGWHPASVHVIHSMMYDLMRYAKVR